LAVIRFCLFERENRVRIHPWPATYCLPWLEKIEANVEYRRLISPDYIRQATVDAGFAADYWRSERPRRRLSAHDYRASLTMTPRQAIEMLNRTE
jgi:hypothetical protein